MLGLKMCECSGINNYAYIRLDSTENKTLDDDGENADDAWNVTESIE